MNRGVAAAIRRLFGRDRRVPQVTGCCGRLGRAAANALADAGFTVRGVDRNARADALRPSVEFHRGGLDDVDLLEYVCDGASVVAHLAACPHPWAGNVCLREMLGAPRGGNIHAAPRGGAATRP